MGDATSVTFKEAGVCSKIYRSLHVSYEASFHEACADTRPLKDLQRVELFTKRWIENSMGRAWQAICSSEVLTYNSIVSLFQTLIAPFGKEHPFSCVPTMLTQAIGRPPFDWPFIGQQVQLLCNAWRCPMY